MKPDPYSGRIFFLGAGFSAGAGVPLTNNLLPSAAKLFSIEAPGLFERVCDYANQVDVDLSGSPTAQDFARLCTHIEFIELREYAGGERWSKHGSREKLALKFFLSKAIAVSTPTSQEIPDFYFEFVKYINPNDIIVTFNWDLLVETAMDECGISYSYNYEDGKIQLVKLHGSINWIDEEPYSMGDSRPDFGYQPIGYKGRQMPNEVYASEALKSPDKWREATCLVDEVKPLIVLPGYGKAFDVRVLSVLWYRIEFLNVRSGGVSIIGLRVSEDDFIVESLFRYFFRGVIGANRIVNVLNPDPEAQSRFENLGHENNFAFRSDCFDADTLQFALLR